MASVAQAFPTPSTSDAVVVTLLLCLSVGVAALTCEATRASTAPFDASNFDVRPHRGQIASAERLRLMLEGSKSTNSNKASTPLTTISRYHYLHACSL